LFAGYTQLVHISFGKLIAEEALKPPEGKSFLFVFGPDFITEL